MEITHLSHPSRNVTHLPRRRISSGREITPRPEKYEQLCVAVQEVRR